MLSCGTGGGLARDPLSACVLGAQNSTILCSRLRDLLPMPVSKLSRRALRRLMGEQMGRRHLTEIELIEYGDGDISPVRVEAAEEHLRQCDLCAETLAASRRTAIAASRLDTAPVPSDLRGRVRARLASDLQAALTCLQALPLLHERVDRRLSPIAAVRLQTHLESCASCCQELSALEVMTGLVRSLPVLTVPAAVRTRVAAANRRNVRESWWVPRLRPALAAAGLVAVGVISLLMRPGNPPVADNTSVVAAMPGPQAASPALPAAESEATTPAEAPVQVAEPPVTEAVVEAPGTDSAASHVPAVRPVRQAPLRMSRRPMRPQVALAKATSATNLLGHVSMPKKVASPVPVAMQVLREVAKSAEYGMEAQRIMIQAAESFPVLNSEEKLDQMPEFLALSAPEKGVERPVSTQPSSPPSSEKRPGRDSASGPDGIVPVYTGPLV